MHKKVDVRAKIRITLKILKAGLLKQYTPLTVSWFITPRCNLDCLYCAVTSNEKTELSTKEVFSIIDELKDIGTERISFTGGEPLLRKDLGDIINYAYNKKIMPTVNTNGLLIPEAIQSIKNASMIVISLDGPEHVNAKSRSEGSYSKILNSIELCKSKGLNVTLTTVLSKHNLDQIENVLDVARKFDIKNVFQPARQYRIGSMDKNPISPDPKEYKKAIKYLIERKINGELHIYNSLTGLKHLYNWPEPTNIKCWSARLFCRIESNGDMFSCSCIAKDPANCLTLGTASAFSKIRAVTCKDCWCATMVEFNLLASMNMDAIMNMLRVS